MNWDGITRSEDLAEGEALLRHRIANAAKSYDWPSLMQLLASNSGLINCCRPGGKSLYSPLHQAAHGAAPRSVVSTMIELGAWRTLCNSYGERPVDIAEVRGSIHLIDLLQPVLKRAVPTRILLKIQDYFHDVIKERAGKLVSLRQMRLPELSPLLEFDKPQMWFPVPGMYGGFKFFLQGEGPSVRLVSESWCRVVEGSEQRHEINSRGITLVDG